jgi:hypothetical protein
MARDVENYVPVFFFLLLLFGLLPLEKLFRSSFLYLVVDILGV